MNQYFPVLSMCWLYGYFDVLPKGGEEVHEALDRKSSGLSAHERRDMRLLDAEDFACLRLRESALLDEPIDAQHKVRLKLLAFRVRECEIRENVAAALPDLNLACFFHCPICLSL